MVRVSATIKFHGMYLVIHSTKIQVETKKWELSKNPTKIEEIQEKKIIDTN